MLENLGVRTREGRILTISVFLDLVGEGNSDAGGVPHREKSRRRSDRIEDRVRTGKTEGSFSWADWRGLAVEGRWKALGELDRAEQDVPVWTKAAKWIDGAIDECVLRAKEQIGDDGKWRDASLAEADRIAKRDKGSWYSWRGLSGVGQERGGCSSWTGSRTTTSRRGSRTR